MAPTSGMSFSACRLSTVASRYSARALIYKHNQLPIPVRLFSECRRHVQAHNVLLNPGFRISQNSESTEDTNSSPDKRESVKDMNLDYLRNRSQDSPIIASKTHASLSKPEKPEKPEKKTKSPEQLEWMSKCRELCEEQQYTELETTLKQGAESGYKMDRRTFDLVQSQLILNDQHSILTFAFSNVRPVRVKDDWVLNAIGSAYAIRDYTLCESIFSKYLGKIGYPIKTVDTMLRCFFNQTNPLVAKEYLSQIWDKAQESTLCIAFRHLTNICQDADEIVNLMYEFRRDRGRVSEEFYATVLECLVELESSDLMIDVTRTVQDDGLFETKVIQEVILQQLLIEGNEGRIEAYLTLFEQQDSVQVSARPFERAARHFARRNNVSGILKTVDWMARCNVNATSAVMNSFLSAAVHGGSTIQLVSNLQGWCQLGICGTNATVHLIWIALIKKYPDHGHYITKYLKDLAPQLPYLYKNMSSNTFALTDQYGTKGKETFTYSHNHNSTLHALRRIQEMNNKHRPEVGIEVIEDLQKRGIKPPEYIFTTVLHGLCKTGLSQEFDVVRKKMEDCGYTTPPMLELIFLRTQLHHMRVKGAVPTHTQRAIAVQRIKRFVFDYRKELNLPMVTSIGFELLYLREIDYAITMFNYFQAPGGTPTSSSHDNDSLCGLLRAYQLQGNFDAIEELVGHLVHRDEQGQSTSCIVTRPWFEELLRNTVHLLDKGNERDRERIGNIRQCIDVATSYRTKWVERDLQKDLEDIKSICSEWEVRQKAAYLADKDERARLQQQPENSAP